MDILKLIKLCEEPSYKVPQGLTREERRMWAKSVYESQKKK